MEQKNILNNWFTYALMVDASKIVSSWLERGIIAILQIENKEISSPVD